MIRRERAIVFAPMPRISSIVYASIALFWVTMWTLLIRAELNPKEAALRAVPIAKVAGVFFRHEQSSELFIHGDGSHLGKFRVTPHERSADDSRIVDFSGNFQFRHSDEHRRVIWDGSLEFDRAFALKVVRLAFSVFDRSGPHAENARTEIEIDPAQRIAICTEKFGLAVTDRRTIPLDEAGIRTLMEERGIDPALLATMASSQSAAPEITARQSTVLVHDQRVDAYLVTVQVNQQTLLEVQLNSLGQILYAKSVLGWTLESE